jgi:hypothetical protein
MRSMTKENSITKMETLRTDADLQAIQQSVAFKNISDAIEQYRRQFGVAFLALIAFSAIHVGLVVIANLYTLQTRVTHGVLTSTTDESQAVGTSSIVEQVDLQFIMTNMNEIQQMRALNNIKDVHFTDKSTNYRQYTVTGFQLGGWRRSELKLYTSVGHVLKYVRGSGLTVYSEAGSTAETPATATANTSSGRHLLQKGVSVSASVGQSGSSSASDSADSATAEVNAKVARWRALYVDAIEKVDANAYYSMQVNARQAASAAMPVVSTVMDSSLFNPSKGTSGEAIKQKVYDIVGLVRDGADYATEEFANSEVAMKMNLGSTHDFTSTGMEDAFDSLDTAIMDMDANAITEVVAELVASQTQTQEAFDLFFGQKRGDAYVGGGWFGMLAENMYGDIWDTEGEAGTGEYGCSGMDLSWIQTSEVYQKDVSMHAMHKCDERRVSISKGKGGAAAGFITADTLPMTQMVQGDYAPWVEGHLFSSMLGYVEYFTSYFPPSYCDANTPKIPSVFMLHGFGGDDEFLHFIARAMDYCFNYYWNPPSGGSAGADGILAPPWGFVVTCPRDASGPMGKKSWYLNTLFTGYHMDFIAFELRLFLIKESWVLQNPMSKAGVFGFSMGGFGSFQLIFAYPNFFGYAGLFNGPTDGNDCFYTDSCYMWCMVDPGFCEILWMSVGIIFNNYVIMRAGSDLNSPNSASPMMHGNAVDLLKRGHYSGFTVEEVFMTDGEMRSAKDLMEFGLEGGLTFVDCLKTDAGDIIPGVYVPGKDVTIAGICDDSLTKDKMADPGDVWMGRLTLNSNSPGLYGPPPAPGSTRFVCPVKYGCAMYCIEQLAWAGENDRHDQFSGDDSEFNQIGNVAASHRRQGSNLFWVNPVYSTMATQYFCPTMNVLTNAYVTECYNNFVNSVPVGMIQAASYTQFGPTAINEDDMSGQWLFMSVDPSDEYGVYHGAQMFSNYWLQHVYDAADQAKFEYDVFMFDHTGEFGHSYCQDDLRKTIASLSEFYFTRVVTKSGFEGYEATGSYDAYGNSADDDYTYSAWWDSYYDNYYAEYNARRLNAYGYYFRPPAPPEPGFDNFNGGSMSMEEYYIDVCQPGASSGDCVPMCFMWSLPISETFGKFEKVVHNGLGGQDVEEKGDKGYMYSESALCSMSTMMSTIDLSIADGVSVADPQPHLFFDAEHYAVGSSHNEASAGHHSDDVFTFKEAPEGYTMEIPNSVSGGADVCTAACDTYFSEYEDLRAAALANATAEMENAVFTAYGDYLEASGDISDAYECLTNVFQYVQGQPSVIEAFMSLDTTPKELTTISEAILSSSCPALWNAASKGGSKGGKGGSKAEAPKVEAPGSATYQYWPCKGGEKDSWCGWNKMTAEQLAEYNMMTTFETFETSLLSHPYSEATCQAEMKGLMEEYVEIQNDAELRAFESEFQSLETKVEAEIAANSCGKGTISVPMTRDHKSFRHAVETICILNVAGLEDKYATAQAEAKAEIESKETEYAAKDLDSKSEDSCTPQEVYDFYTTTWYCYNKKMQQDGKEPKSGPFTGDAVRQAYDNLVAGKGFSPPKESCMEADYDWKDDIHTDY